MNLKGLIADLEILLVPGIYDGLTLISPPSQRPRHFICLEHRWLILVLGVQISV